MTAPDSGSRAPELARVQYRCMACPLTFTDASTANAHFDATGHHQTSRCSVCLRHFSEHNDSEYAACLGYAVRHPEVQGSRAPAESGTPFNDGLEYAATVCESRARSLGEDSHDYLASNEAKKCALAIRFHIKAPPAASPSPAGGERPLCVKCHHPTALHDENGCQGGFCSCREPAVVPPSPERGEPQYDGVFEPQQIPEMRAALATLRETVADNPNAISITNTVAAILDAWEKDRAALAATEDTLADLRAQLAEARRALLRFGDHREACPCLVDARATCNCGYNAAIDAARASVSRGRTDPNRENSDG